MNDDNKLLFADFGEAHSSIKWQWISGILFAFCMCLAYYNQWRNWQIRVRFYWLWSEPPPAFPCLLSLLLLVFAATYVALCYATVKSIGKNEIYVYNNLIKGCGFKRWGFLPRVHHFELKYDEILSVKKGTQRRIIIRSTTGRYEVFIDSPEIAHKIISQFYIDGQDLK